jgi:hypothetical protein
MLISDSIAYASTHNTSKVELQILEESEWHPNEATGIHTFGSKRSEVKYEFKGK